MFHSHDRKPAGFESSTRLMLTNSFTENKFILINDYYQQHELLLDLVDCKTYYELFKKIAPPPTQNSAPRTLLEKVRHENISFLRRMAFFETLLKNINNLQCFEVNKRKFLNVLLKFQWDKTKTATYLNCQNARTYKEIYQGLCNALDANIRKTFGSLKLEDQTFYEEPAFSSIPITPNEITNAQRGFSFLATQAKPISTRFVPKVNFFEHKSMIIDLIEQHEISDCIITSEAHQCFVMTPPSLAKNLSPTLNEKNKESIQDYLQLLSCQGYGFLYYFVKKYRAKFVRVSESTLTNMLTFFIDQLGQTYTELPWLINKYFYPKLEIIPFSTGSAEEVDQQTHTKLVATLADKLNKPSLQHSAGNMTCEMHHVPQITFFPKAEVKPALQKLISVETPIHFTGLEIGLGSPKASRPSKLSLVLEHALSFKHEMILGDQYSLGVGGKIALLLNNREIVLNSSVLSRHWQKMKQFLPKGLTASRVGHLTYLIDDIRARVSSSVREPHSKSRSFIFNERIEPFSQLSEINSRNNFETNKKICLKLCSIDPAFDASFNSYLFLTVLMSSHTVPSQLFPPRVNPLSGLSFLRLATLFDEMILSIDAKQAFDANKQRLLAILVYLDWPIKHPNFYKAVETSCSYSAVFKLFIENLSPKTLHHYFAYKDDEFSNRYSQASLKKVNDTDRTDHGLFWIRKAFFLEQLTALYDEKTAFSQQITIANHIIATLSPLGQNRGGASNILRLKPNKFSNYDALHQLLVESLPAIETDLTPKLTAEIDSPEQTNLLKFNLYTKKYHFWGTLFSYIEQTKLEFGDFFKTHIEPGVTPFTTVKNAVTMVGFPAEGFLKCRSWHDLDVLITKNLKFINNEKLNTVFRKGFKKLQLFAFEERVLNIGLFEGEGNFAKDKKMVQELFIQGPEEHFKNLKYLFQFRAHKRSGVKRKIVLDESSCLTDIKSDRRKTLNLKDSRPSKFLKLNDKSATLDVLKSAENLIPVDIVDYETIYSQDLLYLETCNSYLYLYYFLKKYFSKQFFKQAKNLKLPPDSGISFIRAKAIEEIKGLKSLNAEAVKEIRKYDGHITIHTEQFNEATFKDLLRDQVEINGIKKLNSGMQSYSSQGLTKFFKLAEGPVKDFICHYTHQGGMMAGLFMLKGAYGIAPSNGKAYVFADDLPDGAEEVAKALPAHSQLPNQWKLNINDNEVTYMMMAPANYMVHLNTKTYTKLPWVLCQTVTVQCDYNEKNQLTFDFSKNKLFFEVDVGNSDQTKEKINIELLALKSDNDMDKALDDYLRHWQNKPFNSGSVLMYSAVPFYSGYVNGNHYYE